MARNSNTRDFMFDDSEEGYSAPVSLELHTKGEVIGVSKVGPDRITLDQPRAVKSGSAHLIMKIGQTTKKHRVILNNSNAEDGTVKYF